jgi:hypothetical protein
MIKNIGNDKKWNLKVVQPSLWKQVESNDSGVVELHFRSHLTPLPESFDSTHHKEREEPKPTFFSLVASWSYDPLELLKSKERKQHLFSLVSNCLAQGVDKPSADQFVKQTMRHIPTAANRAWKEDVKLDFREVVEALYNPISLPNSLMAVSNLPTLSNEERDDAEDAYIDAHYKAMPYIPPTPEELELERERERELDAAILEEEAS